MNRIHPEDPRVTAYALGELSQEEAAELERVAMVNPAVKEALDETRQLAGLLGEVLGDKELVLGEERRDAIRRAGRRPDGDQLATVDRYRRWSRVAGVLAAAAVLVLGGLWVLQQIPVGLLGGGGEIVESEEEIMMRMLLSPVDQPERVARAPQGPPVAPPRPEDPVEEGGAEPLDPLYLRLNRLLAENPDKFFRDVRGMASRATMRDLANLPTLLENPYVLAAEEPKVVVPMVAGRASYSLVERFIRTEGKLPPRNTVRIEELINRPIYQDEGDAELRGIRLGAELVRCPWNERRLLLGVLLRNDSNEMLPVSSALRLDVKPDMVRSFRLVGYAETGEGERAGTTAQWGLPPGWSNFVLYELNPTNQEVLDELWVMVRVGLAVGKSDPRGLIVPVTSPPRDWEIASPNFKTASVMAAYGLLLRDSSYKGTLEPGMLAKLAEEALRDASEGDLLQREALQLVIDSESLLIAAGR